MYANCPGSDMTWNRTRTPNSSSRKTRRLASASCSLFTHRLSLTSYRLSIAPRHDRHPVDGVGGPAARSGTSCPEMPTALGSRQLLDGEPQRRSRHRRGVRAQEHLEPVPVPATCVLEEDPDRVVHDRVGVLREPAGDGEGAGHVLVTALADEVERGRDGRTPLQRLAAGQLVEGLQIATGEVPADDMGGGAVHHVPAGDPVVASEVDLAQRGPLSVGGLPAGLEVQHAEGGEASLVRRLVEQRLDLLERHVPMGLGGVEQVAHPNAEHLLLRRQALANLLQLGRVGEPAQLGEEVVSLGRHRRPRSAAGGGPQSPWASNARTAAANAGGSDMKPPWSPGNSGAVRPRRSARASAERRAISPREAAPTAMTTRGPD